MGGEVPQRIPVSITMFLSLLLHQRVEFRAGSVKPVCFWQNIQRLPACRRHFRPQILQQDAEGEESAWLMAL